MSGAVATPAPPIRPLMVSFYFDPVYAGSAIQAFNLARSLQRLGAAPLIVSANLTGSPAHEDYHGVPLYRIPSVGKGSDWQRMSFWASLTLFLARMRRRFDIIHAHGTGPHAIVGPTGRLFRAPTILKVAMAGSDLNFTGQGRLQGRLNRTMVGPVDAYIATTRAIAAEFAPAGLDASRVRLIPNGVDTETNQPVGAERRARLRAELGLPDGPLVATVGIVIARKNVDGALRGFHAAVAGGAPGHFLIIGPMPAEHSGYHDTLRTYVATHGLTDRVTFLGFQSPVTPYLQAADVFLFPSRQEGMPNSVLEAMACGLPCVVSSTAGVEASVVSHEENGFAIDVDDDAALAATLRRLLTDGALRARLGEAARATILSHYSLDAIAGRYWRLYHELLGRRIPEDAARASAPAASET